VAIGRNRRSTSTAARALLPKVTYLVAALAFAAANPISPVALFRLEQSAIAQTPRQTPQPTAKPLGKTGNKKETKPATSQPVATKPQTQTQERTLSLAAEQAFASLDYATAFRAGQQVLSENPKNLAMRRLTASSALQLKKFSDCLKLMAVLTPKESSADDLHLLGECSQGNGSFTTQTIRSFEQSRNAPEKTDAASYWLGVAAYRDGNFVASKRYLDSVAILPARFDEQKKFMLERIADLLRANSPAPNTPKPTATPAVPSAVSDSPPRPNGERSDKAERGERLPERARLDLIPRKKAENGGFSNFEGDAKLGVAAGVLDRVGIGIDEQKAFDKEVETAVREKREVKVSTIQERTGVLFTPLVSLNGKVNTGFRSDDFVGDRGTEYGLGVAFSGSYTTVQSNFYAVQDTRMHPAASVAFPSPGAGIRVSGHIDNRPNPFFRFWLEVFADRLATKFDNQFGQLGAQGRFSLQTRTAYFAVGGFWSLLQGSDMGIGGHWNGFELDAGLSNLGYFGLRAPLGHSLLSYQVSSPIPSSRTTGVFQIVSLEGTYFEVNLAPSIIFSPYFRAMLWYRFVYGRERTYVSSVTKAAQLKKDDLQPAERDSQFDSSLSDFSAAVEYTPWEWGGILGGVTASFYRTIYNLAEVPPNPSANSTSPYLYQPLLDRGKQNFTLGFVSIYTRF
jgi:hypothetical protein